MNSSPVLFLRKRSVLSLAVIAAVAVSVSFVPYAFMRFVGLYINLTGSMVRGIWKVAEMPHGAPLKGEAVVVERGGLSLDGRLVKGKYLLKRVSGAGGDSVSYDAAEDCVRINGEPLPHSKIFSKGREGIPLPHPEYPYVVPEGCLYLSSEHVYGYDSRYFGPVPSDAVVAVVKPLICW